MTGVGRHTLRAWERRYGVPVPDRSGGRQRMYSVADVELIKRMRDLSSRGIPLTRAAELSRAMVVTGSPAAASGTLRDNLGSALLTWDEPKAIAVWTEIFERYDTATAFESIVAPLLREVGDAWHAGTITVAHEHYVSNFVRSRLEVQNRQVVPMLDAPSVVLACVAGEHHEIGLLALSAVLRLHGLRTIYLGRDVPSADLLRVVEDVQPDALALHAGSAAGVQLLAGLVGEVAAIAPLTRVVYGGWPFDAEMVPMELPGATYGGSGLNESVEIINSLVRKGGPGGSK